ncbi:MAG: ATP-dependent helicase HrpB, partial [Acidimicrobiia bacterium]|nr:ATP-dependent helicase HrpB [Acidimicrobiia bacterium]
TTAWLAATDPLGVEGFLVPADLDGQRKNSRIRLAAAIDPDDVAQRFAHEISEKVSLTWSGDRLVERHERRLGGVSLDANDRRPQPGPPVTAALLKRIGSNELRDLPWTKAASTFRARVEFLHARLGEPWPDWSTKRLVATAEEWLGPYLATATGLDDVARLDLLQLLRNHLGYPAATEVEGLVPTHVEIPSGRRVAVDYSGDVPTIAAKVQEFYGATRGPVIAGEPVQLMLLSPADRPIQITSDLGGFWAGSWAEVRKDMAGRYPKHEWPDDPGAASPVRK